MKSKRIVLVAALALAACSESPEPESEPDDHSETAEITDIGAASEEDAETRRERLRERMRAHREARQHARPEEPGGERERRRRLALRAWWDDEDMIAALALEPEQRLVLRNAAEQWRTRRVDARQKLATLQRELSSQPDRDAEDLLKQRERIRRELKAAGEHWQIALEATLNETQLDYLREHHPRIRRQVR